MVLTKRAFQCVANIIAGLNVSDDLRQEIASKFAAQLELSNPNFNRARFLAACGVEDLRNG